MRETAKQMLDIIQDKIQAKIQDILAALQLDRLQLDRCNIPGMYGCSGTFPRRRITLFWNFANTVTAC